VAQTAGDAADSGRSLTGSIVFDGGSRISQLCAAEAAHYPRTSAAHIGGSVRVAPDEG
jgi:hypothetical protein